MRIDCVTPGTYKERRNVNIKMYIIVCERSPWAPKGLEELILCYLYNQ